MTASSSLDLTRSRNPKVGRKPRGLRWRSSKWFIIATVAFGLFADVFIYCLIVPILPRLLQDRVGLAPRFVQSYVSSMLAAFAASTVLFAPVTAYLTSFGTPRRTPYLLGLAAMTGATCLFSFGSTIAVLLVARVLQGMSAAVVWTVGLTLVAETVNQRELGMVMSTVLSFVSVGDVVAPIVGGALYQMRGLIGVTCAAYVVLGLDFIMRLLVIESRVAKGYAPPEEADQPGVMESSFCNENISSPKDDITPLLNNHLMASAAPVESDEDMRPWLIRKIPILGCLQYPRMITAMLATLVQTLLLSSFHATVPTVAHEYYNFNTLQIGLLFLAVGVVNLVLGPISGWCVDRYGPRAVGTISYASLVPVFALFRFVAPGGSGAVFLYVVLLFLAGVGLCGTIAPAIVEANAIIEEYYEMYEKLSSPQGPGAQLYGLNCMLLNAGMALGPEFAGLLKESIGYGNMNAVLAGVCAITAILCGRYMDASVGGSTNSAVQPATE